MKHLFYTWKLGCLLLLILAGCSSKKSVSSYHSFESECLGVELDGSETLRAWGRGKNRTDAIEQAKKNAVRDVLFKGVVAGSRRRIPEELPYRREQPGCSGQGAP